jgi:hypothetical protein
MSLCRKVISSCEFSLGNSMSTELSSAPLLLSPLSSESPPSFSSLSSSSSSEESKMGSLYFFSSVFTLLLIASDPEVVTFEALA